MPANERWFYEPVVSNALPPAAALPALVAARCALDVPEIVPVPDVSFSQAGGASSTSFLSLSSVGDGGLSVPLPPPRARAPLRFPAHRGERFNILLTYPAGEHISHLYSVFPSMLVSALRYNVSCVLSVDSPVFLFTGPTWAAFDHSGTISDRLLPGTLTPCPSWFLGLRSAFIVFLSLLRPTSKLS